MVSVAGAEGGGGGGRGGVRGRGAGRGGSPYSQFMRRQGCGWGGVVGSARRGGAVKLEGVACDCGLEGQEAGLGGVAEEVREQLVGSGHGGVDVLVPEGRRVPIDLHRATRRGDSNGRVTRAVKYINQ